MTALDAVDRTTIDDVAKEYPHSRVRLMRGFFGPYGSNQSPVAGRYPAVWDGSTVEVRYDQGLRIEARDEDQMREMMRRDRERGVEVL